MCDLNEVVAILRSALFEEPCHSNNKNIDEILSELEKQTVLPLVFPILPQLGLTANRYEYWEDQIYSYIITNQTVMDAEKKAVGLLHENHIPCVILKGSSYAQYYPHPELRVRGDIDILVNESDFETAADLLIKDGFISNTTPQKSPGTRHIEYFKDGIEIELHIASSDGRVCGAKQTECVANGHLADQAFDLLVYHLAHPGLCVNGAHFAGFPLPLTHNLGCAICSAYCPP